MRQPFLLILLLLIFVQPGIAMEIRVPKNESIKDALDAVAQMRQGENPPTSAIIVKIEGGVRVLAEPIVIKPEHGGPANAPLIIEPEGEGECVLSGGKSIHGWLKGEMNGHACWVADVAEARDGKWPVRSLWVNGKRAIRARFPNEGYLTVDQSPDATESWQVGQTRFTYPADALPSFEVSPGTEVILGTRWVESRLPVASIDAAARTIQTVKKSQWRIEHGDPFWVEGAAAHLDAPGEWFSDERAGKLYYLPREGEAMDAVEAIAPVLEQLLRFEGLPEQQKFVENVKIRGITFAHSEHRLPNAPADATEPVSGGYSQSDLNVPAAIFATGLRNSRLENCTVRNVGNYGIHLERGCQNNTLSQCTLTDLGAGGVRIGEPADRENLDEQTFGNEVSDCRVTDGGNGFTCGVGVWVGRSYDNRIIHNEIADFFYSGLSIGWSWGYAPQLARGNVIEANHVHHIGKKSNDAGPMLSDMGGIYTLGVQPGTVIRGNVFHDIEAFKYGGWAIYLDEGSTDIVVENNLCYRTTHGGFHLHYGKNNIVRGNVFALGRDAQLQHSRPESHNGFTFEGNLVYWDKGKLLTGSAMNATYRNNRYGPIKPAEVRVLHMSWDEWRKSGQDKGTQFFESPVAETSGGRFDLDISSFRELLQNTATAEVVGPRK